MSQFIFVQTAVRLSKAILGVGLTTLLAVYAVPPHTTESVQMSKCRANTQKLRRKYSVPFNLLKVESNMLYIRNQSVPRCKHFPPRLLKPVS